MTGRPFSPIIVKTAPNTSAKTMRGRICISAIALKRFSGTSPMRTFLRTSPIVCPSFPFTFAEIVRSTLTPVPDDFRERLLPSSTGIHSTTSRLFPGSTFPGSIPSTFWSSRRRTYRSSNFLNSPDLRVIRFPSIVYLLSESCCPPRRAICSNFVSAFPGCTMLTRTMPIKTEKAVVTM
jgi:hypothetical protein